MTQETSVARRFYNAFQAKDAAAMGACYADDARFSDPVFTDLDARAARAMWAMLLERGKDMSLTYEVLAESPTAARVNWIATYTFSKTGRKVVNNIIANMELRDDRIVWHRDVFDFWTWSKQALGFPGLLLGWTPLLQGKIRATAMQGLQEYRAAKAV